MVGQTITNPVITTQHTILNKPGNAKIQEAELNLRNQPVVLLIHLLQLQKGFGSV